MIYLGTHFLFMVSCFYPTTANLWVQVPNNNPRTENRSIHSFESSRQKQSNENGVFSEVDDSEYYYYDGGTDPLISQLEPIAQQEPDDFLQTFTLTIASLLVENGKMSAYGNTNLQSSFKFTDSYCSGKRELATP